MGKKRYHLIDFVALSESADGNSFVPLSLSTDNVLIVDNTGDIRDCQTTCAEVFSNFNSGLYNAHFLSVYR